MTALIALCIALYAVAHVYYTLLLLAGTTTHALCPLLPDRCLIQRSHVWRTASHMLSSCQDSR